MADKLDIARGVGVAALVIGSLEACTPLDIKNGANLIVKNAADCMTYPGGENASEIEAPLGQINKGIIIPGTEVTLKTPENDPLGPVVFGPTGSYVRAEVPKSGFASNNPWVPVGIDGKPAPVEKIEGTEFCWLKMSDLGKPKVAGK
jgi:hypothetical protein